MWIAMNQTYREQKQLYRLKECCEDCIHFCSERKQCEVLYPVEPHLQKTFDEANDGDRIYFCKMFEANDA